MQESISACVMCQTNGKCAKTHAALLQPVPLPDGPWQKVGIDIVGPFESANWDCRYVATYVPLLIDCDTKWLEVVFTCSITTTAITTFLSTELAQFSNPAELVSDNGT